MPRDVAAIVADYAIEINAFVPLPAGFEGGTVIDLINSTCLVQSADDNQAVAWDLWTGAVCPLFPHGTHDVVRWSCRPWRDIVVVLQVNRTMVRSDYRSSCFRLTQDGKCDFLWETPALFNSQFVITCPEDILARDGTGAHVYFVDSRDRALVVDVELTTGKVVRHLRLEPYGQDDYLFQPDQHTLLTRSDSGVCTRWWPHKDLQREVLGSVTHPKRGYYNDRVRCSYCEATRSWVWFHSSGLWRTDLVAAGRSVAWGGRDVSGSYPNGIDPVTGLLFRSRLQSNYVHISL